MNEKENVIGGRIEQLRLRNKQTQQEVADAIGVKRETIYQWETGKRHLKAEAIIALTQYFNVSADYLLGLSDVKTMDPEQKSRFDKLSEEIADCYGVEKQKNQLIEEMAELTQAIIKLWRFKRGVLHKAITEKELMDNLIEEMADVKLVLDQLTYLMGAAAEMQDVMEYKVKREMNRILDTPIKLSLNQDLNTMTMPEEMGDVELE